MRNNADVAGGKPIAVFLQSISGVSAINPLVPFYDIHGGKRRVVKEKGCQGGQGGPGVMEKEKGLVSHLIWIAIRRR
jgi:hypothetical protein